MDPKAQNQRGFLCDRFSNSSCSRLDSSVPVCVGLYMLVAAAILVTVCGNLLVIISICCFKHLHTPTNLLLLSLAVTDLLIGLTVMPFHFALRLEACWCLGMLACKLFYICSCVLSCVSIYSVVFIAVDRYVALWNPFLYTRKMTVRVSLLVITIIWVYSLIYTLVLLYINGNFNMEGTSLCVGECAVSLSQIWAYIDVICVFGVSCSLIIILYLKIFSIAKRHINAIVTNNVQATNNVSRSVLPEAKAAINLGIVVFVFLFCCIPYIIIFLVNGKNTDSSALGAITNAATPLLLNSAVNPIIYALFYPWFRKGVKNILTFKVYNPQSKLLSGLSKSN